MAKLHIDVSKGIFEVEGDPELIREMFTQFKSDLIAINRRVASQPPQITVASDTYAESPPAITNASAKPVIESSAPKKRKKGGQLALEVDKELFPILQTGNPAKSILPFERYISEKFDPKAVAANQNFVTVCMYYLIEKLFFTKGQTTFNRQDVINEMRNAPLHFKNTYVGNLTGYFATLKKADRIRLVTAPDTYSLSNSEKQSLEASLANS